MNTRNTVQKKIVLETAQSLPHPTADQVYLTVVQTHPAISRATVYRNLNQLAEQGKLKKVEMQSGADRYDITLEKHYHINCRICGRVDDAPLPYQAALVEHVIDKRGYLIEDHDVVLRGICPACRALQESQAANYMDTAGDF